MKATTTKSTQIWQSPDGEKKIWQVTLTADGKEYTLKTYSEAIANEGFEGEVETYVGKNNDRFVKQPQQPGRGGNNNAARLAQDAAKQKEIRAEWAIARAISTMGVFTPDEKMLGEIQKLATKLYAMVDEVITANSKEVK